MLLARPLQRFHKTMLLACMTAAAAAAPVSSHAHGALPLAAAARERGAKAVNIAWQEDVRDAIVAALRDVTGHLQPRAYVVAVQRCIQRRRWLRAAWLMCMLDLLILACMSHV